MNMDLVTTENDINPLDMNLILMKTLEFVDQNKTLLNCRLVNCSWNEKAVQLLKQRNGLIHLNHTNIELWQQYCLEISDCGRAFTSPDFCIHLSSAWNSDNHTKMLTLAHDILNLNSFSRCVSIKLDPPQRFLSDNEEAGFLKLVKRSAAQLRYLEINGEFLRFRAGIGNEMLAVIASIEMVTFPQLHSIHFNVSEDLIHYGETHLYTLVPLFNSTPQLKSLKFMFNNQWEEGHRFESNGRRTSIRQLAIALNRIRETQFENLVELEIFIDRKVLTSLNRFQFNKLEGLKLHVRIEFGVETDAEFWRFLSGKCPRLTSLEFHFFPMLATGVVMQDMPEMDQFLSITTVKHFGVHIANGLFYPTIVGKKINNCLVAALHNFPSLESMSMSIGSCFALAQLAIHSGQPNEYNYALTVFQNISTFQLVIPIDHVVKESVASMMAQLHESSFPHARNLTLEIESRRLNFIDGPENTQGNYVHLYLNHGKLKNIEITNYFENWIANTQPNSLQELEQLTLKLDNGQEIRQMINLTTILTHCPKLTTIQADSQFLANNDEQNYIAAHYPHLRVEQL